jgi:hypothetical protein
MESLQSMRTMERKKEHKKKQRYKLIASNEEMEIRSQISSKRKLICSDTEINPAEQLSMLTNSGQN